ncbi:MAG: polysaccharide deacetylase family protein [Paludibacteraceae bacterium]|nr:polysaccharide deacetylase family protein [Paludibacteraceae bacterium]
MNKLFYQTAGLVKNIPLKYFINITGKRIIVPFYHCVSDESTLHIKHLYKARTTKSFEKDLDFLLKNYTPIDIHTLTRKLNNNERVKDNCFLLSFDDGLREFYDIIAPILNKKGIPAICFLNSDFVDNKDLFFRYKESIIIDKINTGSSEIERQKIEQWLSEKGLYNNDIESSIKKINYSQKEYLAELAEIVAVDFDDYLEKHKPYLSSEQIKQLIKQGYAFGAHSIDHPLYSDLDLEEQLRQTKQSLEEIAALFKLNYKLFAFPFTDSGVFKDFFETIFSRTNPIADISFGTSGLKNDPCNRNIQRIPIEVDNFSAEEIIYGEYLYFAVKALLNKNKIRRD